MYSQWMYKLKSHLDDKFTKVGLKVTEMGLEILKHVVYQGLSSNLPFFRYLKLINWFHDLIMVIRINISSVTQNGLHGAPTGAE